MIFKKIARKILKNEIDELKQKLKERDDEYYEVLKERVDDQAKTAKDLANLKSCHETIKQLTSENEIKNSLKPVKTANQSLLYDPIC